MAKKSKLTLLGKSGVSAPTILLESFPRPKNIVQVTMTSDEVTATCPVTGQPDQYTVEIVYAPKSLCIESKSLKLKLQSYRNKGLFVESFADELADHIMDSITPINVRVSIWQKPRGGVAITAVAERNRG